MRWSTMAVTPTSSHPGRGDARRATARTTLVSCSAAAIARPTSFPKSPGSFRLRPERLGARAGDLRLRASPHHVRLPIRAATRTAFEAYNEGRGVCRDFAHLAIALCRCMNIPARYCTGYLGDIGVPPWTRPWTSRVVRGVPRRPLVHVRRASQHAPHRAHPDRARP